MTLHQRGIDFLSDVDVRLSVELGRTEMKLRDVLSLGEESLVMLDRLTDELLDVAVNGTVIAKGEIVSQGNRFGLRIVEMAGRERAAAAGAEVSADARAPAFDPGAPRHGDAG